LYLDFIWEQQHNMEHNMGLYRGNFMHTAAILFQNKTAITDVAPAI